MLLYQEVQKRVKEESEKPIVNQNSRGVYFYNQKTVYTRNVDKRGSDIER